MSKRVLVVDDEQDWVETYRGWLEPDGYEVRGANTVEAALGEAARWKPHVVLVDQKLEGGGGRDLGLSAIDRLARGEPYTRLILVTAYATREAVERAFRSGASDYLEKGPILEPLVRIKVQLLAEDAARALGSPEREAELRADWSLARSSPHPQQKGAALERTVRGLFQSVDGLQHARTNVANGTEEIDVLVMNQSVHEVLRRQGDVFVVECKNWSTRVGADVFSRLRDKVTNRYGRARLGVCVALGGFADTVRAAVLTERRDDVLYLLLDADDLQAWVDAPDREAWLIRRLVDAVVGDRETSGRP
ncbi:MAG: response regulator [Myxococcota bacterium]